MKKLAVIKADSASGPEALGLKPFRVEEVTREVLAGARRRADGMAASAEARLAEAEATLNQARVEAEAIREMARRDAENTREAARQEGFRLGREEGLKEGRAEGLSAAQAEFAQSQAQLLAALGSALESIERGRAEWLAAARQDLIELAMAIARRVARHVGQRDRDVVLANLEEAIRLVGARSEVTLSVHPVDAEAARVFAGSLLELKENWRHIQVVEEPEVSPGGCRVHWGNGSVDATLETQLDRIEAELKGE